MYYWSKPTLPWKNMCLPYWTVLLEEVIIKQEFGLCWLTEWTKVQSSHCYYELQLISYDFRTKCSFTAARSMNAEKTFRTSWWASSPAPCASTPPPCPEMISGTLHFSVSLWHHNTSTHVDVHRKQTGANVNVMHDLPSTQELLWINALRENNTLTFSAVAVRLNCFWIAEEKSQQIWIRDLVLFEKLHQGTFYSQHKKTYPDI